MMRGTFRSPCTGGDGAETGVQLDREEAHRIGGQGSGPLNEEGAEDSTRGRSEKAAAGEKGGRIRKAN